MAKEMIKRKDGSVSQRGLWDASLNFGGHL